MWNQIERLSLSVAIMVCSGWIVGQSEWGRAASFPYQRLAQLKDGGSFYTHLGKAAVERGDYHRAVRLLTSAIRKGGRAEAFKYRSQAYEGLDLHEKASADVERYIGLKPRDPWGYTQRGTRYNLASRHDKALAQFLRAAKLDPSYVASHFGLGIAYTALERHEAAVQEFRNVLELEPENTDALLNLGVALMLSGRPSEARAALGKALQAQEDPRWKSRLQGWIASLLETDEHEAPWAPRSTGQLDGTNRGSNFIEDPNGRGSGHYPVPNENNQAGDGRLPMRERTSEKVPDSHEVRGKRTSERSPLVVTGRWNTRYRGVEFGVTIKQVGKAVSGVMTVDGPFVGSNSYPFEGTYRGGILKGRSSEGHSFQGKVHGNGEVVGKFVLKGGPTIPVNFYVKPGTAQPTRAGD